MNRAIVFLCFLLVGCAASRPPEVSAEGPEVISMAPLPPLTSISTVRGLTMNVLFHLLRDGTVQDVRILGSTGDRGWDSLAAQSMKQWRFTPIAHDSVTGDHWFRQKVIVQIQEPVVMDLGELVCHSQAEADSLYLLLERGADFDTLARRVQGISSAEYYRSPGAVEIARFPQHVRSELMKLGLNAFTPPLQLGHSYVIYKRFPDRISSILPE
jgi:TonB family protein